MEEKVELRTEKICKDFGPVRVLYDVDFELLTGEVHAVIGENGAGKSTLMKIITGYHQPSEGKIYFEGKEVDFPDISAGEEAGIVMIHQELNLAQDLTVEENIFLGQEKRKRIFLDQIEMREKSRELLDRLHCNFKPGDRVGDLSVSNQQMVEIAKALSKKASIIIMDEPTSALTREEVGILFEQIRELKQQDISIIFVSHKLEEVEKIGDRATILRDGKKVTTDDVDNINTDEMANLMVGRELSNMYPDKEYEDSGETILKVKDLSVPDYVETASFELKKGEILGFAGLVGAGRTELMEAVVGLRKKSRGDIYIAGERLKISSYMEAVDHGIVYLTEDRKEKGLLTEKKVTPNFTLLALEKFAAPFIDFEGERNSFREAKELYDIRIPSLNVVVDKLSGGNQQKLVLAKIMEADPEIVIFDEPTRGIDVGTKQQIYNFIKKITGRGMSCIFISSELQEIIGICHRVVVMHEGRISGILEEEDNITEETIMKYATGLKGVV